MSSARSPAPLGLSLAPSRILLWCSLAAHALALAAVLICDLLPAVVVLLAALIGASLAWNYFCHGSARSRWFIEHVRRAGDGGWSLTMADGTERPARLVSSYAHPQLLILNFALGPLTLRSVVVPPDAADGQAIRRLRVALRMLSEQEP